jgi:Trypsin-like peptidase domain
MDAYSRSVAQIELFGTCKGAPVPCGLGTGFFFKRDDELFLITNWHVVTGVDPTSMTPIDDGPLPEVLLLHYKQSVDANGRPVPAAGATVIGSFPIRRDLYKAGAATWYEHSTRQNVDVVGLKLLPLELGEFANIPINEVASETPQLQAAVGMDCFVLGYPEGMIGPGRTPIWKRGSIASEPIYNYRDKPGFLIDTATRNGMSGSPVVARHSGILSHSPEPGKLSSDDLIGTMTKFVGIYSGRIGDDLMGVQLGMVWRSDVLDDILTKRTPGMNPLR